MDKELIEILKKLISYESTKDRAGERKKVLAFCEAWFKKNKIKTKRFPHKNHPSLLATIPGKVNKTLLMLGHLDVVPGPKKMFKPVIKGNKMYGRGTNDDKGPVAMMMLALKDLNNIKDRSSVKLLLTTDEEIGGDDGVGRLAKLPEFKKTDAIFVPDGGSQDHVVCKAKGLIHLKVKATGKAAHGAFPWKGENAVDKIIAAYQAIQKLFTKENLRAANHWHATVNLGFVHGGDTINKVPDEAEAGIDIRFTENFKLKELEKKVKQTIKPYVKILDLHSGDQLWSNDKDPLIKKYQKIMGQTTKIKIKSLPEHGASDARYFNFLNVPTWLHYPVGGGLHSLDEWVDLESLSKMGEGLKKFISSIE